MRRGRGGPHLGLVLIALLVISVADVVNGCVDCVVYSLSESKLIYFSEREESYILWFQAEGQFNFTGEFSNSFPCLHPDVILPVPPDEACKLRNLTIQREEPGRLIVYIDGEAVSQLTLCPYDIFRGIFIKTPRAVKVFISEDLNLLKGNEFCSSISSSPVREIKPQSLLIMLAVAITVAVITIIYACVIHCKYRQLVLKPVTAPMPTTLSESAQAKAQENNSDLKKSCLLQDTLPQVAATHPQQTSFQVTYLQEGAPQFPPPRPSSLYDSENSLYGAVIF